MSDGAIPVAPSPGDSPRDYPSQDDTAGFAARLRARTAAVHREAERAGLIADLLRGRASRAGYVLFLRNLVPVYDALEAALAAAPPAETSDAARDPTTDLAPVLAPFADPGLHRRAALRADLAAIAGPHWAAVPILPEARAYAAEVAAADAAGLVAHAYARYLGDLSGGQILKPVLARNLGLAPDALGFYDFPALPEPATLKAAMREALDRVAVDGAVSAQIVEGAIAAFRHNIAVSEAASRAAATLDGVAAG